MVQPVSVASPVNTPSKEPEKGVLSKPPLET
jgi:hypothetical protein